MEECKCEKPRVIVKEKFNNQDVVEFLQGLIEEFAQKNDCNSPEHYKKAELECIKMMEKGMPPEEFRGYCKGNIWKYTYRYKDKGKPITDIKKAIYYACRMAISLESEE